MEVTLMFLGSFIIRIVSSLEYISDAHTYVSEPRNVFMNFSSRLITPDPVFLEISVFLTIQETAGHTSSEGRVHEISARVNICCSVVDLKIFDQTLLSLSIHDK